MLVNTYDTNINKAFANIYSSFADAMFKKITGEKIDETKVDYLNIDTGLEGVKFISKCVESVEKGSVWVEMG